MRFSGAPQEALEITLVPVAASIPVKRKSTPSPDLKDPFGKAGRDDDNSATSSLKDPFAKPPAPAARRTSTLRIGVLAGDGPARVSIDGRVVGTTPIVNQRVTPGMHRIRWVWDDGHSFDKTITIADGEILLVKNG